MVEMCRQGQGLPMRLLPSECRAARGLLNWRQADLADRASVSRSTIRDFEGEIHALQRATMDRLIAAFEEAGVELLGDAQSGTGARIRP
ncbi:helix-turn-helix domain-containing protein [Sphingobium sp. Ndbn-10]|uniref:helix-turn-helix domain-containing protein n=1 Tax=Sphingobium sp. Ndbn-10 TaxID=1667223 RepID=UPI001BAE6E02|nr:helix-turn-helix domain-containing protein [Sphingobium sp. Ndbn-10]